MKRSEELKKLAAEKLAAARAAFDKAEKAAKDEKRDITEAEQAEYRGHLDEHAKLRAQAETAEQIEVGEAWAERSSGVPAPVGNPSPIATGAAQAAVTDEDVAAGVRSWLLYQSKPSLVRDEDVARAKRIGIHPGDKEITIRLGGGENFQQRQMCYRTMSQARAFHESRALSSQIAASGGLTIAPLFNAAIESALLYFGPMMQVSEVIRTQTGADLPFMTDNETTKSGSYVGENTAITTTEDIDFAATILKAYKATTNAILVPYELLNDTSINLVQYIGSKLGERLGRFINTQATTGATKARGITTRSTAGYTAASSTAIAFDELVRLCHSVDIAYRNGATWMFNDAIALAIRLLKNGVSDYLWTDGTQAGQPDRLLGHSVAINNDMTGTMASAAKTVEFGQLSKYKIRMVDEIRITTTDQRYWEYDQTAFAAYVRFDGDLIDAGTNPVKHLVHT